MFDFIKRMFHGKTLQSARPHLPAAQLDEPSDQTEVPLEVAPTDSYTRWLLSVAEEGTASTDILWLLVDDPNPDVRFCLAETYDIDTDILTILSADENPYVAHRARKTLTRLQSPVGQVVDHDFGFGEINRLRKRG